ncbi:MAG: glycosyltransferase family 2 protein [Bacteroidota bacterium]
MLLVIPMAGRGSRFSNVGYATPKPLIEVSGKPMIHHAFKSVADIDYRKVVFIALKEHEEEYRVSNLLKKEVVEDFELILLDEVTEGQLCTVLTASSFFKPNESILIAASDSYIKSNIAEELKTTEADGLISVIDLPGEQWSFAKTNEQGKVIEVAEKNRISNHASTGIYYFSDSMLFEQEAKKMIANKETTRGEYYVMPLYNKWIQSGKTILLSHAQEMWDMGTPEAKQKFEQYLKYS